MNPPDLSDRHSFSRDELIACGHGELFGEGNARLPLPNMLMFDRITRITGRRRYRRQGRDHCRAGYQSRTVVLRLSFPKSDPVMPGCLGLDAMWQLVGFFLGWKGNPGRGRALGSGEVKFFGQVLPEASLVRYELNIKRLIERRLVMGIADGRMLVDGKEIYTASDLRVGLFTSTEDF